MTETVQSMINDLIDVTKETSKQIYTQGVVEGVKIVKNLVETEESARDIDTLLQSLDMFIKKYEVKVESSITPVEETTKEVEEVTETLGEVLVEEVKDEEPVSDPVNEEESVN